MLHNNNDVVSVCQRSFSMGHRTVNGRFDVQSTHIHGTCSKHYDDHCGSSFRGDKPSSVQKGSLVWECIWRRQCVKTSGMRETYWDLKVQHATYLTDRLPSASLGDIFPYDDKPDLSHIRFSGSQYLACYHRNTRSSGQMSHVHACMGGTRSPCELCKTRCPIV